MTSPALPGAPARDIRPTVLVADDSATMRHIVTGVLEGEGFAVVAVEDGMEVVQAAYRLQPDAVVLDVQMPRLSGYVAARLLKEDWQTAHIPVVMLTSLRTASDRYWAAQAGVDRFLTKDFEAPELGEAVHQVLLEADTRGRGRRVHREPVDLTEDEVLARVCDVLDRKLFDASVVADMTRIAAEVDGFDHTVAAVLEVLRRVVDHDLAAVLLEGSPETYVSVAAECAWDQYHDLMATVAEAASTLAGRQLGVEALMPRVADARHWLGAEDSGRAGSVVTVPLRARGGTAGVLVLTSAATEVFDELALSTLALVEPPAALVLDAARLARLLGSRVRA